MKPSLFAVFRGQIEGFEGEENGGSRAPDLSKKNRSFAYHPQAEESAWGPVRSRMTAEGSLEKMLPIL